MRVTAQSQAEQIALQAILERPSIDECLMVIAGVWATRSTCLRGAVGCVLADASGVVISSGYSGAPAGLEHCSEVGCLIEDGHCVRSTHAEINAVANAAKRGAALAGATAVVTVRPCLRCTYVLIAAGATRIVYLREAPSERNTGTYLREVCESAGVTLRQLTPSAWVEANVPDRQRPKE